MRLRKPSLTDIIVAGLALTALLALSVHATPARAGSVGHVAIVGGAPAADRTFPWLAHIEDFRGHTVGECAGSVVAPNLVLTAGHCAENTETEVEDPAAGYYVTTGAAEVRSREAQVSRVSDVMVFPKFHYGQVDTGDAALLVLSTPRLRQRFRLLKRPAKTRLPSSRDGEAMRAVPGPGVGRGARLARPLGYGARQRTAHASSL
jgi:secreted trypsin-like serine protease